MIRAGHVGNQICGHSPKRSSWLTLVKEKRQTNSACCFCSFRQMRRQGMLLPLLFLSLPFPPPTPSLGLSFPCLVSSSSDCCGRVVECRIKDNSRLPVSGVTLPSMAAEEPAPPAAPVPADPAKPQKKRSPNRLVVEEALNDDNSEPWLTMVKKIPETHGRRETAVEACS